MASKLTETDELKIKFNFLADELGKANTHLFFYKELLDARNGKYQKEFIRSLDFWEYTITAHFEAAFLRLCRVYDEFRDKKAHMGRDPFHLDRFVKEVKTISGGQLEKKKRKPHADDLSFLRRNRIVTKLRKWRHGVFVHRNHDLLLNKSNKRDDFLKKYPLNADEIQKLIDMGFSILERWADYYKSKCPLRRLVREERDYLFVLESLRLRFI